MRIDLPTCGFKSCKYCFDGNCTKKVEYDRCEYRGYKDSLQLHGRWEWDTQDIYWCTNCNEKIHVKEVMGIPDWKYCPSCGAKMDGGDSNANSVD